MMDLPAWLHWLEHHHPVTIDLGLARVKAVADRLGLLPPASKTVVVAGTNGKGSTVAALEAIACQHKLGVFSYTSPHLFRFNERFRLQGQMLDDEPICQGLQAIRSACESDPLISLSYFEYSTLLALWLSRHYQEQVDLLLLEVGLGGRLDAVNIVDADVAIITSIGMDHQEWLGDTLDEIAIEKAGIVRAHRPVILAEQNLPQVLKERACVIGAEVIQLGTDYHYQQQDDRWSGQFGTKDFRNLPRPQLKLSNVSAAIQAFILLFGDRIRGDNLLSAVTQMQLPGRFSQLEQGPQNIWFDVAHNPDACAYLASNIRRLNTVGKVYAVCSFLMDKDVAASVQPLLGLVDQWFCAALSVPRAMPGQELQKQIQAQTQMYASIEQAFTAARSILENEDNLIVFGSFYTVSIVAEHLRRAKCERSVSE